MGLTMLGRIWERCADAIRGRKAAERCRSAPRPWGQHVLKITKSLSLLPSLTLVGSRPKTLCAIPNEAYLFHVEKCKSLFNYDCVATLVLFTQA